MNFFNRLNFNRLNLRRTRKPRARKNRTRQTGISAEVLEQRQMLSAAVPQLESLQGAPVTIYLDFDGHFEQQWGVDNEDSDIHYNVSTPVFDLDNNSSSFSQQETAMIEEIWKHVAEDFSPFNINVTTVEPPASEFADGAVLRVAIGGSSDDWYTAPGEDGVGGISLTGSFYNNDWVNTVYVFPENLNPANLSDKPKLIGDAVSHEAGHAFGLKHQSLYDGQGTLLDPYNPGNAAIAPIMGNPFDAERSVWWISPADDPGFSQDDARDMWQNSKFYSNGSIGFRADDYTNEIPAQPTIAYQGEFTAQGIITPYAVQNGQPVIFPDVDYFAISLGNQFVLGSWEVTVNVADVGPNLDVRIEVYDTYGNFLTAVDPGNSLDATVKLGFGEYWIAVMGHNRVGQMDPDTHYYDMGQYTFSVSFSFENTNIVDGPALEPFFEDPLLPFVQTRNVFDTARRGMRSITPAVTDPMRMSHKFQKQPRGALGGKIARSAQDALRGARDRWSDAPSARSTSTTFQALDAVFQKGLDELLLGSLAKKSALKAR